MIVDPIDLTDDGSEPKAKRPRIESTAKSSLAMMHEHNQQLVQVKQEKTVIAESLRTVTEEKEAIANNLEEAKEDLEDANETVQQQLLATDIWQRRFDELAALVAGNVDGAAVAQIRN
jgi:gas vesicle protein